MINYKTFLLIGFTLTFMLFLSKVDAIGLAIAPINIELFDAERGENYERMLVLYNYYEDKSNLLLNTSGDCSDWISFYPMEEPTKQITSILVPAKDTTKLLVKFKIPEDIPNGNYTSTIFAQRAPEKGDSGSAFGVRVRSNVKVEVTNGKIVTTTVESITTTVTETTQPQTTTTETTSTTVEETSTTTVKHTIMPTGQLTYINPENPIFIVLIIIASAVVGILIKKFTH